MAVKNWNISLCIIVLVLVALLRSGLGMSPVRTQS
jgi:hypothetical protein